jgi:predicted glycosyltransferase
VKVVIYCQHVLGMGHFARTVAICRALADHAVVLVSGGPQAPFALPAHVRAVALPELAMDRDFQNLRATAGGALDQTLAQRRETLRAVLREEKPDVFLLELYPLGRKAFRHELDPVLADIAAGRLPVGHVISSVRDILVEKENAAKHEARAVRVLNQWFQALLVHADPRVVRLETTFGRLAEIRIPVIYTGFVSAADRPAFDRTAFRARVGIPADHRLVVASAGSGAVGFPLLQATVRAVKQNTSAPPLFLQVFTGPHMPAAEQSLLQRETCAAIQVADFSPEFRSWLRAADLSVSMAGYNTCMDILATGVPALVWPFAQNREQGLRAGLLAARDALRVLVQADLAPDRLAACLTAAQTLHPARTAIDLAGARGTAAALERLCQTKGRPV